MRVNLLSRLHKLLDYPFFVTGKMWINLKMVELIYLDSNLKKNQRAPIKIST